MTTLEPESGRQVQENLYAAMQEALRQSQARAAVLVSLLREFTADGDATTTLPAGYQQWGDTYQASCQYCDWDARGQGGTLTYPHADDCLVTRARAALTGGDG